MAIFISTGNEKTGFPSFNLLAGDKNAVYTGAVPYSADVSLIETCGTCSGTCPGCYALRMTRYPAVYNHYAENTRAVLDDPEKAVFEIENALFNSRKPAPAVFRFHDSGDYPTFDYFECVMNMAGRHVGETRFYGYTKENDFVYRYGVERVRDVFGLVNSPWPGVCEEIPGLPQFIYDDGTNPDIARLPHCPAVNKAGKRTGVTCSQCRFCPFAKPGQKRAVYAH